MFMVTQPKGRPSISKKPKNQKNSNRDQTPLEVFLSYMSEDILSSLILQIRRLKIMDRRYQKADQIRGLLFDLSSLI